MPLIVVLVVVVIAGFIFFKNSQSSVTTNQLPSSNNTQVSGQSNSQYTLTDVAPHNSRSDCWTVIDNNVYNITNFIDIHPGGSEIIRACGVDASALFASVRDHDQQAVQTLPTYKIGTLKN